MVAEMSRLLGGEPLLRKGYRVTPLMQFEAVMVAVAELIWDAHSQSSTRRVAIDRRIINDPTRS